MIDELYVTMFEMRHVVEFNDSEMTTLETWQVPDMTKWKDLGRHLPSMDYYVNDSIYSNTILYFFCKCRAPSI